MKPKEKLPTIERRYFPVSVTIEKRNDGEPDSRKIVLYAAAFNKWSQNFGGWFREKFDRNAFNNVLNSEDTVALFNHDMNQVLARNKNTLALSVDDTGLRSEFDLPNTTLGNDMLELVKRGDIKFGSVAFSVKVQKWAKSEIPTEVEEDRTILEVEKLYDVSLVTTPAYPDTSVARRSFDESQEEVIIKDLYEQEHLEAEIEILNRNK